MAGLFTTIGIFGLFFLLVILPMIKRQRKLENKYSIKANDWKFSGRHRDLRETSPTNYSPAFSDLPGNVFNPENK
ncbi:MAG: hypothetical protein HY730_00105 [Candidatus Tectomicrobia bacterium]|uniref:Uncharacterized protein n=1 Tax=Tectimicrobiota bacterium TaxID=2528274 RepID=A0A933LP49_UNCTE|nr:hypothetical protein [Candidatus Tectomicrobia bacterium]